MSCSARLPVYALMIAATIPAVKVFGLVSLPGLTLLLMYTLGVVAAFGMSWLFRRTLLKGESNVFLMELPPYRAPHPRTVLLQMLEVLLVQGPATRLQAIANEMLALRGVITGHLQLLAAVIPPLHAPETKE